MNPAFTGANKIGTDLPFTE